MPSTNDRMHVRLDVVDGQIVREMLGALAHADAKFPGQSLPDGTGEPMSSMAADYARMLTNLAAQNGTLTWYKVMHEEWLEAAAETDPDTLAAELDQIVAVAIRWRRDILKRTGDVDDGLRCPTCHSPQPSMHPAVSGGGEVTHLCADSFHQHVRDWPDGIPPLLSCGRDSCQGHGIPGPHAECGNGGRSQPETHPDVRPVTIAYVFAEAARVALDQFIGMIRDPKKRDKYKAARDHLVDAMNFDDDPFNISGLDAPVELTEAGKAAMTQSMPCRGDAVDAWLTRKRDTYENHTSEWTALDHLLDDYRMHEDTGTPLDREAGPCDTCQGHGCGECNNEGTEEAASNDAPHLLLDELHECEPTSPGQWLDDVAGKRYLDYLVEGFSERATVFPRSVLIDALGRGFARLIDRLYRDGLLRPSPMYMRMLTDRIAEQIGPLFVLEHGRLYDGKPEIFTEIPTYSLANRILAAAKAVEEQWRK